MAKIVGMVGRGEGGGLGKLLWRGGDELLLLTGSGQLTGRTASFALLFGSLCVVWVWQELRVVPRPLDFG